MEQQTKNDIVEASGQPKELANVAEIRMDSDVPSWLANAVQADPSMAGAGLENIRRQDIQIPRVILMQALSPAVAQEGKFKAGDLVHSIDQTLIAEPGSDVKIVVIKHFLQWIAWKDRDVNKGGILESSFDENSELAKKYARGETSWEQVDEQGHPVMKPNPDKKAGGQVPAMVNLIEYHNFVVIMPEIYGASPIMISCGKTNWKHGKNLTSRMKTRGGVPTLVNGVRTLVPAPSYAAVYTVKSDNETNSVGQIYKVFKFNNAGWAPENVMLAAKSLYESFKDKAVVADVDDGSDAVGNSAAPKDI